MHNRRTIFSHLSQILFVSDQSDHSTPANTEGEDPTACPDDAQL